MGVQQQLVVNKPKNSKPVSEARKIRKPLMERKRRERINTCLNDLSSLLVDAKLVKTEPGKQTKLEKADILELTVKHIKSFKNQEKATSTTESDEEKPASSYKEGFTKCMGMVDQTLGKAGKEALRQRLLTHLKSCLQTLEPPTKDADSSEASNEDTDTTESRLEPTTEEETSDSETEFEDRSTKTGSQTTEPIVKEPAGPRLTLVPTRLPSGGVAFIIHGGLDPNLLLPQADINDIKTVTSSAPVSPPPSPTTCDSSTSTHTSSPTSPLTYPSAVSPSPSTSSMTPTPCFTPTQCPATPSPPPPSPPSNAQSPAPVYVDLRCPDVIATSSQYPVSQTDYVTSCMPSAGFTDIQNAPAQPYTTFTSYSTSSTPVNAYSVPATLHQGTSTSTHILQIPSTSSFHIQTVPTQPQPIPQYHTLPHHSRHPPTPPPSISPQNGYPLHQYQHYMPVSSEEDMDTDGLSEEEIDIDVENDVPYDLSMRRIWRYW